MPTPGAIIESGRWRPCLEGESAPLEDESAQRSCERAVAPAARVRLWRVAREPGSRRRILPQAVDAGHLGLEPLEIRSRQLLIGRLFDLKRVDLGAAAQHLVV